jgi:effector-binding domain-containing protein
MLKIGDFSKLSQVSIKALRLYDQKGLLKPSSVDRSTGYRFYSAHQLPRLNRILAFKDLGFSLEEIAKLLTEEISPEQIRGMLRLKQGELEQHIMDSQARLGRVAARLKQIEMENSMANYDVVLKKIAPMAVISRREILPHYGAIGGLFGEIMSYVGSQGINPQGIPVSIWHDSEYKESDVDGEAVVPIDPALIPKLRATLEQQNHLKAYELPGYDQAACIIHQGSYQSLPQAYSHLLRWIEENKYQIVGNSREVCINAGVEQDNESYITEIQFPVEKIALAA